VKGRRLGTLFAGSFAALYEALVARIASEKKHDTLAPVTVIVGSGVVARRLAHDLARTLDGWANVRIATLHAIADELAVGRDGGDRESPTRPADRWTLSSGRAVGTVARRRLLAGVIAGLADDGHGFWSAEEVFPGVPAALLRTVDDLRLAGATPEDVSSVAGSERVRAVADALAAYEEALSRHELADDAATYADAAAAVGSSPGLLEGWGAVCVFGIYDFPDRQADLLEALVGAAGGDVFVPTVASGGEFARRWEDAVRSWVDDRVEPAGAARRGDLETLRQRVFEEPLAADPAEVRGDDSLAIVSVADEAAEVRRAGQELLRAAGEGVRFRDMAVIAPDAERSRRMAALLESWGIPVAGGVDAHGVAAAGVLAVLDCLAPLAGGRFSRRAVLQVAAAAVASGSLGADAVVRWTEASRTAGVVGGADDWKERLRSHVRSCADRRRRLEESRPLPEEDEPDTQEEQDGALAEAGACLAAAQELQAFVGSLVEAATVIPEEGSWRGLTEAIVELAERVCGLDPSGETLHRVRELASLDAVDAAVDLPTVASAVRQLLVDREERRGEPGRAGVAVGGPESLRGLAFDTIVFTGLAEGGFPARPRQDPLLLDEERVAIASRSGARLPLAADREAEDRFLFALTLAAAERRLVLLIPRGEAGSGRPRTPSRTAVRVCESLAGRPVSLEELDEGTFLPGVYERLPSGERGAWLDERDHDLDTLARLREGGGAEAAQRYFGLIHGGEAAARIRRRRAAAVASEPGRWDAVVETEGVVEELAVADPFRTAISSTALEEYLRCPFRFYLTRILGLRLPEDAEEVLTIEPLERGIIAHAVLERVFRRAAEAGAGREEAIGFVDTAADEEFLAAERRGGTGLPYVWEIVREELRADLREAVSADPVWAETDELEPSGFELRFGSGPGAEVALALDDGDEVRFKGRMDRLDASPDGSRLRVVDYKTGGGSTERDYLRRGLSVQLAVYTLAARALARANGQEPSDVQSIYRFVTRRGGFTTLALDQTSDEALERLRAVTAAVRDLVAAGVFPRSPRQPEWTCGNCDLGYACDDTVWARRRKRDSDRLATLVALQEQKNDG